VSRFFKSAAFPIIIVVVLAFFAQRLILQSGTETQAKTWNDLQKAAAAGQVTYVKTNPDSNSVKYSTDPQRKQMVEIGIPSDTELDNVLSKIDEQNQADISGQQVTIDGSKTGGSPWWSVLTYILPFVLFFGFWIFLMNQVQGGGSKVMSFGKSRAKRLSVDSPKITFKDVAGVDEAVEELH
jgi:cell division protease FtsH